MRKKTGSISKIEEEINPLGVDVILKLENLISTAVSDLYGGEIPSDIKISATVPTDTQWGDYTTNIGMFLATILKHSPLEIARNIQYRLISLLSESEDRDLFGDISVAAPGYINFKISDLWLQKLLSSLSPIPTSYGIGDYSFKNGYFADKKVLVEYTDPNPFKVFHIGHLMPNAVGECLARMFEFCGADVRRASYQGDVGMHVAKSIWGILKKIKEEGLTLEKLEKLSLEERIVFLGKCYVLGAKEYSEGDIPSIQKINAQIYIVAQEILQEECGWAPLINYQEILLHSSDTGSLPEKNLIKEIYRAGREWSLEYFETVYKVLGTKFDFYYFESMAGEYGYKIVQEFCNPKLGQSVFEKDNGAVIYRGEQHGLHTRVFINSKGLPTYESKDLGLPFLKQKDFDYDLSYIVTASEQSPYFQVVLQALKEINPDLAEKTFHVAHGMLNLTTGKMSSRTGDVISADELLSQLSNVALEKMDESASIDGNEERRDIAQKIAVAALKYAILRQQLGTNIAYDREKSLQLVGDTGPYLQYSYVRAFSILEKAGFKWGDVSLVEIISGSDSMQEEVFLLRKLSHFQEILIKSLNELSPSYICTYLHDLASIFNSFYAKSPILVDSDLNRRNMRLALTNAFAVTLKAGLDILGISVVNKM